MGLGELPVGGHVELPGAWPFRAMEAPHPSPGLALCVSSPSC